MELKKVIVDNVSPQQLFKSLSYRMDAAGIYHTKPELVAGGFQFKFARGDQIEVVRMEDLSGSGTVVDLSLIKDKESEYVIRQMLPESLGRKPVDTKDTVIGKYNLESNDCILGLDESGKGDYFGPLVITGVTASKDDIDDLFSIGLKDHHQYKDNEIEQVAGIVTERFPTTSVIIKPDVYNEMFIRHKNMNLILLKAHVRSILVARQKYNISLAMIDRIGDQDLSTDILGDNLLSIINTFSENKHPLVSAAAIVARCIFLRILKDLSEEYRLKFPLGVGDEVVNMARSFIKSYGLENLFKVAKVNFQLTGSLL